MNAKICATTMIGMSLILASMIGSANAESIGIHTLQQEIDKTESILVTGFVNAESFYIPVKLEMYDSDNNLIFSPDVRVDDDGQFRWLFHPPLGMYDTTGTYTIIASHEELSETATIQFTVVEKASVSNAWLEDIKVKTSSNEEPSNTFSEKTTQSNIEASDNRVASSTENSNVVQKSETSNDGLVAQKSPVEQIIQPTNTPNQQNIIDAESPVVMTAIALSIAGIVSGVVIWTRTTYMKPTIKK